MLAGVAGSRVSCIVVVKDRGVEIARFEVECSRHLLQSAVASQDPSEVLRGAPTGFDAGPSVQRDLLEGMSSVLEELDHSAPAEKTACCALC